MKSNKYGTEKFMENEEKLEETVGEMHKRRETMTDGVRYIIFYTFGTNDQKREAADNV